MNRFLTFYYQQIKPKFLDKPLHTTVSENPFFILSAGRSGSTLLRKLLLINTAVNIPPESDDLIPKLVKFYLRNNHKPWENIVAGCLEIFKNEPSTEFWNIEIDKEELLWVCKDDKSLAGIISSIYSLYSKKHNLENQKWGDKTPFLTFRLSWINLVYPQSKYIFLVRDGRAVVNSFLKMNKSYTVETATKRWLESIHIINNRIHKDPESTLLLKYEDLISNTNKSLEVVNKFLGIDFSINSNHIFMGDDILPHHENVHSEVSKAHMDKWKGELNEKDINWMSNIMNKELKELGYVI